MYINILYIYNYKNTPNKLKLRNLQNTMYGNNTYFQTLSIFGISFQKPESVLAFVGLICIINR